MDNIQWFQSWVTQVEAIGEYIYFLYLDDMMDDYPQQQEHTCIKNTHVWQFEIPNLDFICLFKRGVHWLDDECLSHELGCKFWHMFGLECCPHF